MASTLGDVQQTFSSWDTCMQKDYCKWPAIVGIIVGSLVVLSIVFCIARCLCFGAECCACCFSCLSCCCPGRKRRAPRGYDNFNPGPPAAPYQQYPQYSSPPQPSYRGPQTATFDAPSKMTTRYNEDALPSMPTWDTAASRRVEEEPVEMETLDQPAQQRLLGEHATMVSSPYGQQHGTISPYTGARSPTSPYGRAPYSQGGQSPGLYAAGAAYPTPRSPRSPGYGQDQSNYQGVSPVYAQAPQHTLPVYAQAHDQYRQPTSIDTNVAMPYHDYNSHQQYAPSMSPASTTAYAPSSTAPPSYHTRAPSLVSPVQSSYNAIPARRPVQGTWRDV